MAYEQSAGFPSGLFPCALDTGVLMYSPIINAALVVHTSGAAWVGKIFALKAQTAGTFTLYVYVGAVTGTPDYRMQIWDGPTGTDDDDRPMSGGAGGADLVSSPSTLSLSSADNTTWVALSGTVTLALGQTYFVLVHNTHATPASNYATFAIRGALDAIGAAALGGAAGNIPSVAQAHAAGSTVDGFSAADPTYNTSGPGSFCIKYTDGTCVGHPWVGSETHASNTNDRGERVKFSEDVVVSGTTSVYITTASAAAKIYPASGGAAVATHTLDRHQINNAGTSRFAPARLTGGTSYDLVWTFGSASTGTVYTMGEVLANVPADVLACVPLGWAYVDGTTPGSYTADASRLWLFGLIIDDNPAIAGGGVFGYRRKVR